MDVSMFVDDTMGELVDITGSDPVTGSWRHKAFIPTPLSSDEPPLSGGTYRMVAAAGRALAALDATAQQLPNPYLLRTPSLRREAQSTSALEGTYAPLREVLTADDDAPTTAEMTEILNYVRMANSGFLWAQERRPITLSLIEDLQGELMRGTPLESASGRLRDTQVMIGRRPGTHSMAPVHASRFIPVPPGDRLRAGVRALVDWLHQDHTGDIDPIIAAGMAHYQFEALHPFRDGNGRLGRFLIVLTLLSSGVLSEPTLTVSPWFEERRAEYYDALLRVSTHGDWDTFLAFFSQGLAAAATNTRHQMLALAAAHQSLKETVRASSLRSAHALDLVDFAVANPSFTVRKVEAALGVSYGRANSLVAQLTDIGVFDVVETGSQTRRFAAPAVLKVLLA
ncbi:Fic family protein [Actinomyces sp. oral taxon 171]|uniref:Fic family protein n=1 Tax=Actinomyces sp. oral taxon 171 TaxID=706438 RepID=UPI0001F61A48|nr:Fic/DOC family N-terminal domain-containing protein [Actinomyces sp. oral taxon 171]EFW27994.1 Fic family protein [Actinomyces sp. oral taxon 171 str. F0337]QCT32223.1 Fic family protein [Actinomyces sp. oral taxon 171 str. F0337]